MGMLTFANPKVVDETLDYTWSYSKWLPTGDTIAAASFVADDNVTLSAPLIHDDAVTIWVSGGTVGTHTITCIVTTAAGRVVHRSATLTVVADA